MPPPLGLSGRGSTVEHSRLGDILQSCRTPGFQGSWPFVAADHGVGKMEGSLPSLSWRGKGS